MLSFSGGYAGILKQTRYFAERYGDRYEPFIQVKKSLSHCEHCFQGVAAGSGLTFSDIIILNGAATLSVIKPLACMFAHVPGNCNYLHLN
jgi:hypothetical protein